MRVSPRQRMPTSHRRKPWSPSPILHISPILLLLNTLSLTDGFHAAFIPSPLLSISSSRFDRSRQQQHSLLPQRPRSSIDFRSAFSVFPTRPTLKKSTAIHSSSIESQQSQQSQQVTETEIRTLFSLLCDTTLLFDPSRGQCCRNKCSGCTYLDSSGNFIFDEYTADGAGSGGVVGDVGDAGDEAAGGWLAPYVKVDFGERVHTSKWSEVLFPEGESKKEIERSDFPSLLLRAYPSANDSAKGDAKEIPGVSSMAVQALWTTLSPSAGYPRLSPTEIIRAIKGMEGSMYDKGGAVDYAIFKKGMLAVISSGVGLTPVNTNGEGNDGGATLDYDSMSKEELLDLVVERGMKTNFPKMKRIIIEELRFFDAHGRQGKRHPVKNTLS